MKNRISELLFSALSNFALARILSKTLFYMLQRISRTFEKNPYCLSDDKTKLQSFESLLIGWISTD